MEHWPGHVAKEKTQTTDKSKDKGVDPSFWQWPHLVFGSVSRATLVSKDGRVQLSSVIHPTHGTKSLPLYNPVKVFPETRSLQVDTQEHSARKRAEKGLQYLRTYFPDADFPGELLGSVLEGETEEARRLGAFDSFLGNLLEIVPSHHSQNESIVVFPMGELGSELNISRLSFDDSGNTVFNPTGSPSFSFRTPILQISCAFVPSEWLATQYCSLLIRTHASSSLLRLERSKVTKELDITRSDAGDVPIVDSRILASGPDIVVVNRKGELYKCNTYRCDKAMEPIGAHEISSEDDFWQLGTTRRADECFLASCKAVKHIDLRAANSFADLFSLDHPNTVVTSFEGPIHDHISHITTTSDVIWLDDRFHRRPLLSYKHYRSFDRTLRVLSANLGGASFSLLTSRKNSLVTLYDVARGSDGLLHCNPAPSALPHDRSMFTTFDGDALVAAPSDRELTFLRLCRRGSIHRQDIRVVRNGEAQPAGDLEQSVTHQWDEAVHKLARQTNELWVDFGPAGGRHYTQVNLRGAYESIFALTDDIEEGADRGTFEDTMARLPDIWKDAEETAESMLTTFDVISGVEGGKKHATETKLLSDNGFSSKQIFNTLRCGRPLPIQDLGDLARWHYSIQDTSIPALKYISVDHEHLKQPKPVSGVERDAPSVQRQTEARESLVVDLALSKDVYSPRPIAKLCSFAAGEAMQNMATGRVEPPEVKFGYFRPVRKAGADHYADKEQVDEEETAVSSSLGVRLLLAEWEVGADPENYTYRDPYGDTDAQTIPPQKKLPTAPPTTQKKQMQPQRPPPVVAAATQPPAVHPFAVHGQIQHTHSQQQFKPGPDVFSQEPVMSTQVLPGPFGGRPGARKKGGKKRIGGF